MHFTLLGRAELMIVHQGGCHCGNITYDLYWPGDRLDVAVRACSCDFCTMHGGTYTSHTQADLVATIKDASEVSKYQFGTRTADFYVCSRCGAVPFVTSEIDDHLYAVVNVNTLRGVDVSELEHTVSDFDGESTGGRLERRSRTWIPNVRISQ